ncbi:MAG: peptidylprolyl isomerase [Myxococcota bacterium]|nr:peptidylprolyl isomerase [Myxococcota bacterium]
MPTTNWTTSSRPRSRGWGTLALVALATPMACSPGESEPAEAPASEIVARVDDEVITVEEFDAAIGRLPKALQQRYQDPQQRARYLDQVIDNRLLLAEARRRRLHEDDAVRGKLEDLERRLLIDALQRAVAAEAVSDEALRAYYDAHQDDYSNERVRVRHVLVKDPELAERLRGELEGGADFPALAREHSIDPTAQRGGDLGYVPRGRMDPAFERAAFGLAEPGDLSAVVRTRFGYHVIQLVERPETHTRSYDQVKLAIRQKLQREAVDDVLAGLRERAEIEKTLE